MLLRRVSYAITLPPSISLPLNGCYCHCEQCRLCTGFFCALNVGIQPDNLAFDIESVELLSHYVSSASARRGFCSRCGTTMTFESSVHGLAIAAATLNVPQEAIGAIRNVVTPTRHVYVGSTKDGGISVIFNDGLPRFPRTSDGSTRPTTPTLKASSEQHGDGSNEVINGSCCCGGVKFSVARFSATDENTANARKWMKKDNRFTAAHCFCDDCRLAAGTPFFTWAFIPPDVITITEPHTLVAIESPKRKGVRRQFCGTCGCTMFYDLQRRGGGVGVRNVSAAVLDQEQLFKWLTFQPTWPKGTDPADETLEEYLGCWFKGERGPLISSDDQLRRNPELVAAIERGRQADGRF
ncbi:Mss4-like protein [Auriculariales sp. MPI-PUGE-AT-0066]|nr:Mss4-like protein [Auriculariales sp. MPI-PUGE-AT-0066]